MSLTQPHISRRLRKEAFCDLKWLFRRGSRRTQPYYYTLQYIPLRRLWTGNPVSDQTGNMTLVVSGTAHRKSRGLCSSLVVYAAGFMGAAVVTVTSPVSLARGRKRRGTWRTREGGNMVYCYLQHLADINRMWIIFPRYEVNYHLSLLFVQCLVLCLGCKSNIRIAIILYE